MTLWVLDTDHVSFFQKGNPLIIDRMNNCNPEEVAITVITVEEQLRGRLRVIREASSGGDLSFAYRNFLVTFNSLTSFHILDFSVTANGIYQSLVNQRVRIGKQDLRIASIAMSVNAILVTRNRRDFSQVPDLTIENWLD